MMDENQIQPIITRKPFMTWAGLMLAASLLFSATSYEVLSPIFVLLFLLFAIIGLADKYVMSRGVPVRKDRALNIFAWILGGAAILIILFQMLIPAYHSVRMKDVPHVEYYDSGQKKSEIHYKNGKTDGLATLWYENGQKKREAHWKNDKLDGPGTAWYENGQKKSEGQMKNDKVDGLETWWHANGQKSSEIHYKNGELDGLGTAWGENGNKTKEIQYKGGKEISRKEF